MARIVLHLIRTGGCRGTGSVVMAQDAKPTGSRTRLASEEILRINTEARPVALQVALLLPLLAGLLGLLNGFRMARLPDPEPAGGGENLLG